MDGSSRTIFHGTIPSFPLTMPEYFLITLEHCASIHNKTVNNLRRVLAHLQNVSSSSVRPDVSGNTK